MSTPDNLTYRQMQKELQKRGLKSKGCRYLVTKRFKEALDHENKVSNSNQTNATLFEVLPVEVLLVIFEYLSAFDVHKSFFNLNSQLNSMIHNHLPHSLNLIGIDARRFLVLTRKYMPLMNIKNVKTLVIQNFYSGHDLLSNFLHQYPLSTFNRLSTLVVKEIMLPNDVQPDAFKKLLLKNFLLPQLEYFKMVTKTSMYLPSEITEFFESVLTTCPSLNYLHIDCCPVEVHRFSTKFHPIATSLKHLVFTALDESQLLFLYPTIQNLQYLRLHDFIIRCQTVSTAEITLSQLTRLELVSVHATQFDLHLFAQLFKSTLSHLQYFTIGMYAHSGEKQLPWSAQEWESLLVNAKCIYLKKFHLELKYVLHQRYCQLPPRPTRSEFETSFKTSSYWQQKQHTEFEYSSRLSSEFPTCLQEMYIVKVVL